MKQKKVVNKGYTLEVYSWENDADYPRTEFITVASREKALVLHKACTELFCDYENGGKGIGNSHDYDSAAEIKILEFVEKNPLIIDNEKLNSLETVQVISEIAGELMGFSDFYDFRVCESCTVTYSPEDIYVEEIAS